MSDPSTTRLIVAELPQNKPTRFALLPGATDLAAISDALGLEALRKVRFEGAITSQGKTGWRLDARLGATVVQPCVVTLAPVTTRIEDSVVRRFLVHLPEEATDADEIELPEDETIEKLGNDINLLSVLSEALALALPLYPRADGAALDQAQFTEPGKAPMRDEDARPFAGLKALRDGLTGNNDDEE